jgi:hypothetical protein
MQRKREESRIVPKEWVLLFADINLVVLSCLIAYLQLRLGHLVLVRVYVRRIGQIRMLGDWRN